MALKGVDGPILWFMWSARLYMRVNFLGLLALIYDIGLGSFPAGAT